MNSITLNSILFISYFIGSINSAIIICKIFGLPSPRSTGSKNPGATNVMRIAGKKIAALTFLCDALKSFIPIIICKILLKTPDLFLVELALVIILGHMFPIFFGFKGGKGIATFFGALIAINLPVAALTILTWLVMTKSLKISALSALTACFLCPFYCWFFISGKIAIAITIICFIITLKHHSNIRRMLTGKENSFKKNKPENPSTQNTKQKSK